MKKVFILSMVSIILFSCDKTCNVTDVDQTIPKINLIGNWRLIEVLNDPGDGSGVFRPVDSEKTITFYTDGIVGSNGSLCGIQMESAPPSNGTYSISDSTITAFNCYGNDSLRFRFNIVDSKLIISYVCVEECPAKLMKVE